MIIVNGELREDSKIELDSGFFFGRGLFETVLVNDKPIFLKEHLQRLNKGLLKIGVKIQISEEYFLENIRKLNCKNCGVKIAVSEKNIVFTKREIAYKEEDYIKGFTVKVSKIKRNPHSHITYLKSLNYIDNAIEREAALKEGYNEVLFLNNYEYLSEGSISNIFFVKENKIYTPSIESGLLPGVVRRWVIDNYNVLEGQFILKDLLNSDGAFLTNSLMGIMKIDRIEKNVFEKSDIIDSIELKYRHYICR
ncbi:aminotransferase class IV [Clostridium sp. ZS2-4]|uniref:aminotransferase class IV n=1 Tax=Clostridium sp. ZS2-4 TaxID=2987703 RepID=UPI00227BAC41|nr:aminotransferase class IV [Clostridium sp. ZS2-4]MCY6356499.1 aminotransferase class IV [Clostridium sp. ZS2-4]